MTMRRVDVMTRPVLGITIAIHRDSETREYRVRILGRPEADYFTDDKSDAYGVMMEMFDRASQDYWHEHA